MLKKLWFAALAFTAGIVLLGQQTPEKLAPFYPTPESIVQKMLELGALKAGEWHFDLGSGDGRIVGLPGVTLTVENPDFFRS